MTMASTVTSTPSGASGALQKSTQEVALQRMRLAGRRLLATIVNQALKIAVDRVVAKVEDVADRLDAVAESGGRLHPSSSGDRKRERDQKQRPGKGGHSGQGKPSASLNYPLRPIFQILHFIRRRMRTSPEVHIKEAGPRPTNDGSRRRKLDKPERSPAAPRVERPTQPARRPEQRGRPRPQRSRRNADS